DAEWLEAIYYWQCLNDAERAAYEQAMAGYDNSAFESAPRILQEHFIFPYVWEHNFAYALWEEGGWDAVNQAYSDPPQSTEQILHPEKYVDRDEPQAVTMPDLETALGTGWSELDTDVMGEFLIKVYLETFVDAANAAAAAEGWDGDRYIFLGDGEGNRVLAMSSVWDSITEASEFFDTYIEYVAGKGDGSWALLVEEETERWWQTEGFSLYLGRVDSEVLIVMAPGPAMAEQVLSEFPVFYASPQADFTASPAEIIEGETIVFTDYSTGDVTSWSWDFNGDGTADSTEQNPTHVYAVSGSYTVSLTVSNAVASDTETKSDFIYVSAPGEGRLLARQTISPNEAAVVQTEDARIILVFPAGATADTAVVRITEESKAGLPSCPSGFKASATCFSIELTEDLAPGAVVTITVRYCDADLKACGGNPDLLTLARYDRDAAKWVDLPTTVNTAAQTLTATTDKFSEWMVLVFEPAEEPEPEGPAGHLWIWIVGGVGGLLVLAQVVSTSLWLRRRLAGRS
ncbi:PKD domain-containing protein, partial [Chloroflexota bacterium]